MSSDGQPTQAHLSSKSAIPGERFGHVFLRLRSCANLFKDPCARESARYARSQARPPIWHAGPLAFDLDRIGRISQYPDCHIGRVPALHPSVPWSRLFAHRQCAEAGCFLSSASEHEPRDFRSILSFVDGTWPRRYGYARGSVRGCDSGYRHCWRHWMQRRCDGHCVCVVVVSLATWAKGPHLRCCCPCCRS